MVVNTSNVTNNSAAEAKALLDYNGRPLTTNEVLVPQHMDEGWIKENVTNLDSIRYIPVGEFHFKVVNIAFEKQWASEAWKSFNSEINDLLGHYQKKNTISLDGLYEEYGEYALASTPSAEDEHLAKYEMSLSEAVEILKNVMPRFIEQAPKEGYAYLLYEQDIIGADFASRMLLGHEAANNVLKTVKSIRKNGGLSTLDVESIKSSKGKNHDYYKAESYKMLDKLLEIDKNL